MYIMIVSQCTWVYPNMGMSRNNYPVHVRTAGLCVWKRRFVYVKQAIEYLTIRNILLSVIHCLLIECKHLQCGSGGQLRARRPPINTKIFPSEL